MLRFLLCWENNINKVWKLYYSLKSYSNHPPSVYINDYWSCFSKLLSLCSRWCGCSSGCTTDGAHESVTSRVTAPAGRQTGTSGAKAMMRIRKVQSEEKTNRSFQEIWEKTLKNSANQKLQRVILHYSESCCIRAPSWGELNE